MILGQRLERFLFEKGFENPDVRRLVRNQIVLACGLSLVLMLATLFHPWALAFCAGSALATFNFWYMVKAVQKLLYVRKGAVASLLMLFYGRLIITVLAIIALILWCDVSIVGLLFGLSTVVVSAITWGLANVVQKVKEA